MKYAFLLALVACGALPAQQSTKPVQIPDILVTAERGKTSLTSSTAAVTKLSAEELSRMPHATLADLLRLSPGFSLVNADGSGFDPRVIARGFYGGGEAEYVVVMIDGKPVNQLNTGLVAWDALPVLASIESIEIVRGSSSALYGDAALGGSINIITKRQVAGKAVQLAASGGSDGLWRGSVLAHSSVLGSPFSLTGGVDRTSGYRDHAERTASRASLTFPLVKASPETGRLDLIVRGEWRHYEDPGPLLETLTNANPKQSDALFRFDKTTDAFYHAILEIEQPTGSGLISGSLTADNREIDARRTIALAPGYGDTKDRDLTTRGFYGTMQYDIAGGFLPRSANLIVGGEYGRGKMTSKYFLLATGDRDAYLGSDGARGDLDAAGDGKRSAGAVFAELSEDPVGAVHITAGVRADWLRDTFTPRAPDDVTTINANHSAVSPKVGINFRYLSDNTASGHLYLSASRSFKAPTLDQLFDQRSIPVPFPPYSLRTSNSDLQPQFGTNIEGGLFQSAPLGRKVRAAFSVAVYTMEMKDELDFDVAQLKYANIGKSRHRGVEAGLQLHGPQATTTFVNYTVQSAISRSGDNSGKYLKAIPRNTLTAGISIPPTRSSEIGVVITNVRNTWLDDANTVPLAPYTIVDAHASLRTRYFDFFAEARNLTGTKYQSSGYLDPAGTGAAYFYPGAGRTIEIGIRR